jgi:hypothetical protein
MVTTTNGVAVMARALTHLPSHSGKILTGRVVKRGERITCKACRKQIEYAERALPSYVAELVRNLSPGYVERVYTFDPAGRNADLARNAAHYANLLTFEGRS